MSLTQTLMNGGMIGTSINPAKYNHDNGALRIATESVEELHDIFMTTFYATEQAELGAVHEGVALENSSYAAVYEGAVADAFTKVKEFLRRNKKAQDAYWLAENGIESKATFAVEIIYLSKKEDNKDFCGWSTPKYIKEGLLWLRK